MFCCRAGRASVKTEFFVGKYSHPIPCQPGPALYIMWYVVTVVTVVCPVHRQ